MTNQHPITPCSVLVNKWWSNCKTSSDNMLLQLATQAAQWGSDQELEDCCEWLVNALHDREMGAELRAARRPKPPSDKEQALAALDWLSIEPCLINGVDVNAAVRAKYDTIRKALEAL